MYQAFFIIISIAEVIIFTLLIIFFNRLRTSEELLTRLHDGQASLLDKLYANATLEQELMDSFVARQRELVELDGKLDDKTEELKRLLEQAESVCRSPQFLRELIIGGAKKGRSPLQLAKGTGLSLDEVNLILQQNNQ